MRWKPSVIAMAVLVAGAALCVRADGDTRPATAAEKDFYGKVFGLFARMVPACPAGWTAGDRSQPSPPTWVPGTRPHPVKVEYRTACRDIARLQAAQQKQMSAMQSGGTLLEDPQFKALMEKQQALAADLGKAAQKNDTAAMQRIQQQLKPVSDEMQKLSDAYQKKINSAVRTNQAQDAEAKIAVSGNRFQEYLSGSVTKEAPIAGLPVYRVEPRDQGNGQREDGTTWAFLGAWRATAEGGAVRLQAGERSGPTTSLQTVVVQVKADKVRARNILEKMDWAGLKGLVTN